MSNFGFFRALDELGIRYQKTDVGDKYVYACMREHGHGLGGEQSGHIIFGDIENTGDGITASLRILAEAPTDELCRKADDIVLEAVEG